MSYFFEYFPEPGIAHDICKMLYVKLNPQTDWQETLTSFDSQEKHIKYIIKHANQLPDPKSELALFVYKPIRKSSTFLSKVLISQISSNFKLFSITHLLSYFSDLQRVRQDILTFYLGEQDYNNIDLDHLIRFTTAFPDRIKVLLFGFILYPHKYISFLTKTINQYYSVINDTWAKFHKYNENLNNIIDLSLKKSYSNLPNLNEVLQETPISYSICFTTPDFLYYNLSSPTPFIITTDNTINQVVNSNDFPLISQMIQVTHAISDKYRISIINQLFAHPNMTMHEISTYLGLSLTTTKYHVNILKKANLVKGVSHNRQLYYFANPFGFKNAKKAFEKLEKGEPL